MRQTNSNEAFEQWNATERSTTPNESLPDSFDSRPTGTYRHCDGIPTDIALYNRQCWDDPYDVDLDGEPQWPLSLAGRDETATLDELTVENDTDDTLTSDVITEDDVTREQGGGSGSLESGDVLTDQTASDYDSLGWVNEDKAERMEESRTDTDADGDTLSYHPRTSFTPSNSDLTRKQQEKAEKLHALHHEHFQQYDNASELSQTDTNRMRNRKRTKDRLRPIDAITVDVLGERYVDDIHSDYNQLTTNEGSLRAMTTEEITLSLCVIHELQPITDLVENPEPTTGAVPADGGSRALYSYQRLSERVTTMVESWCPIGQYQIYEPAWKTRQSRLTTCTETICEQLDYEIPSFISSRDLWPKKYGQ